MNARYEANKKSITVRVPKVELKAWKQVTKERFTGHVASDREAMSAALRVALHFTSEDQGFVEVVRDTINANVRANIMELLQQLLPDSEISIDIVGNKYTVKVSEEDSIRSFSAEIDHQIERVIQ